MTRRTRVAVAIACAIAAFTVASRPSHAVLGLGGPDGLDPTFCKQETFRQTIVYIDDMMMVDGKNDWIVRLGTKLQASLSPGEQVVVVRLSPGSGESKEIWNGCWPDYSAEAQSRMRNETNFFTRNPLNDLEGQHKFFLRDFGAALLKIYRDAKRPPSEVLIDPAHPPTKQILRALAADEGRFSQSRLTIRAIVYSDLAESSDIGSIFVKTATPQDYGTSLGTYLRRSVFYAFGVDEDIRNGAGLLEATRRFWSNALRSMTATVGGFGTDLNVPNAKPVAARTYEVDLKMDGQDLDGRLALLVDQEGTLVDTWIGISRLTSVGLSGTFRCQGKGEDALCSLQATTMGHLITNNLPSETIMLSGKGAGGMKGEMGMKGAQMLPLTARPARD